MVASHRVLAVHSDEAVRVRIWQRPNENGVRRRHNSRRHPNAKRRAEHRRHGERRRAPQRPETDARVTQHIGQPVGATAATHHALVNLHRLLAHGARVAELRRRPASSFVERQAPRDEIRDARLEVELDLVVDVAARIAPPELEVPQPAVTHTGCSSAFRTL